MKLFLERDTGGETWEALDNGQEPCDCVGKRRPPDPECDLCSGSGRVPKPHLHQPGRTRAEKLRALLPGPVSVVKSREGLDELVDTALTMDEKLRGFIHHGNVLHLGFATLRELADIPWHERTVQVETFVNFYEWLACRAYGRPPGEPRFTVPMRGRTIVKPGEMQKVLHYAGNYEPNTEYVTRVQWRRPAREHFPEFIDGIARLKSLGDPATLRAVFWLT